MSTISRIIERAAANVPTLTEIDMSACLFSATDAAALASALARNTRVKRLRLQNNRISREGVASIASAFEENTTLEKLAFWGSGIPNADALLSLATLLRSNESLVELDLSANGIGPEQAAILALALRENKTLRSLEMIENIIGDEGAAAFASALHENSALESLNVTNNNIGAKGAASLAAALQHNSSLQELHLVDNEIGSRDATAFASALRRNSSLRTFDLGWNEIGDEGASSIASALRENKTIEKMDLSYNAIGSNGAVLLLSALEVNKTMTSLMLDGNQHIEKSQRQGIKALISRNRRLEYIHETSDYLKEEYDMRSGQGLIDSIGDLNRNPEHDFESIMFVLLLEIPEIMERAYFERFRKKRRA